MRQDSAHDAARIMGDPVTTASAAALDADAVRAALGTVRYPGLGRDLVSFGMVRHVSVCGTQVKVQLALRARDSSVPARLRDAVTERVTALGATLVNVEIVEPVPGSMTVKWSPSSSINSTGSPAAPAAAT